MVPPSGVAESETFQKRLTNLLLDAPLRFASFSKQHNILEKLHKRYMRVPHANVRTMDYLQDAYVEQVIASFEVQEESRVS